MGNSRNRRITRKHRFRGNRHTINVLSSLPKKSSAMKVAPTASEKKLADSFMSKDFPQDELSGNQLLDMEILAGVIKCFCCPMCLTSGLCLQQSSVFGLASNMKVICQNCDYLNVFCTSKKVDKLHAVNASFVLGLRLIGKGHSAARKLCSALDVNTPSKNAFRALEKKLSNVAQCTASEAMNEAALEIRSNQEPSVKIAQCGVSVDGTWQRRGHSSLNGCVTVISVDSGKVLDTEVLSKVCRICKRNGEDEDHDCVKHTGSSNAMEVVGVYRIFERSPQIRSLQYTNFYGDGDSKGYDAVREIYGKKITVVKHECIGHIQKRVGSRLRKLKSKKKGLGGHGKLTDVFIDKLQNYYGIAIRSNVNDLDKMQTAVISAFFHCCSNAKQPMHGQCPVGPDSWCKFQRASATGKTYKDKNKGLPKHIINIVKPIYMQLCDRELLKKCLHGLTQNANESFNGVVWKYVPKEVFVELETLKFAVSLAVIQFNKGYKGLLSILECVGVIPGAHTLKGFLEFDVERVSDSRRHSLPSVKVTRKKNRQAKKGKIAKIEQDEGVTYKSGEF